MAQAQLIPVLDHLRRMTGAAQVKDLSDAQLLQRFTAQREESAFAALVQRHGRLVWSVCRQVLHHEQDAEDAFQATFLVLARQAASIRASQAVASWLYRVAHRIATKASATQARRHAHEQVNESLPQKEHPSEVTWRELQELLHEELDRLPEKYRAPFLLCCLEGKTREEAAQHLGWKEGTLSARLAQARKQLRQRLARRGVTLASMAYGWALSRQAGAAPAALVRATVRVATLVVDNPAAGVVSAPVAALMERGPKALVGAIGKIALLLVLAASLATAGRELLARPEGAAPTQPSPAMGPQKSPAQGKAAAKPGQDRPPSSPAKDNLKNSVTLKGRVLGPDGKPIVGAELYLGYTKQNSYTQEHVLDPAMVLEKPRVFATTGADGRFDFTVLKTLRFFEESWMYSYEKPLNMCQVVARAKGYGPAWVWINQKNLAKNNISLRLPRAEVPIQGRVLDLQGRPVAGAAVRLIRIETRPAEEWLDGQWVDAPRLVTTGKDGRFRLTGVGQDHIAVLRIEGPTIEQKEVLVFTRTSKDGATPYGHYPATFEHFAGPTKPIVGTVRDRATKKPLAGVVVSSSLEGYNHQYNQTIFAVTDARGSYRLLGLPKKGSYEIWARPKAGQHFLAASQKVGDTDGLKPLTVDFNLRRGVPVRFRFIDKETGQTVRGSIQYDALYNNPLRKEAEPGLFVMRSHGPDKDGYFNLVAFPGPGMVMALANYDDVHYLGARLDPADKKAYPQLTQVPFTLGGLGGGFFESNIVQGYRVFNSDRTDKVLTFEISLLRGRALQGKVVGPDGKPLAGALAYGLDFDPHPRASVQEQTLKTASFTAVKLDPRTSRTLTFVHKERKLIGHVVVRGDATQTLTVRLQPWGTLEGRLVDDNGKPLSGVRVKSWHGFPAPGLWPPGQAGGEVPTDRKGRFRLEYLVPGLKRELILTGDTKKGFGLSAGNKLKELVVQPGEVKNLGDIPVKVIPVK
jgi:RNA polymerase sigma factor (sigma-70 family)